MSNYPPGVTGNEPQISGVYPPEQVVDSAVADLKKAEAAVESAFGFLDDQGVLNKDIDRLVGTVFETLVDLREKVEALIDEPDYEAMEERRQMRYEPSGDTW